MKQIIYLLTAIIIATMSVGCNKNWQEIDGEGGYNQGNILESTTSTTSARPLHTKYEPEMRYNEDLDEYYDAKIHIWDEEKHEYIYIEDVSQPRDKEFSATTMEDWINTRSDTSRALDRAMIKIPTAIAEFHEKYPEASKSQWPYLTYGTLWEGPYGQIAQVSLSEMPLMFEYILEDIPMYSEILSDSFRYFVSRANPDTLRVDDKETRSEIIKRYSNASNIMPIYRFLQTAISVDQLLDELIDGRQNEESIYRTTFENGIGALPYYYDKIINNNDYRLLKYAHLVIPCWLKYEDPSQVIDETTDEEVVLKALSRCEQDVQGVLMTIEKYRSIVE